MSKRTFRTFSRVLIIVSFLAFYTVGEAGEIIVKLKSQKLAKGAGAARSLVTALGLETFVKKSRPLFLSEKFHRTAYLHLTFTDSTTRRLILQQLSGQPEVLWAEDNNVCQVHDFPSDSLYQNQWYLPAINAEMAWQIEKGSPDVVIGVIDTGVDHTHPDLAGQLWVNTPEDLNGNGRLDDGDLNGMDDDGNGFVDDVIGWDFTDAPNFPDAGDFLTEDNDPMDEYPGGHGTAVAGVIAAAENGSGTVGVAPGVRVMALRAGTANGFLEEDDVARAIVYAVDNGCRVINMSFGDVVFSNLIHDAVVYGIHHDVIFVCSAGNSGNNITQYPAGYDETLSVGAVNSQITLAPFSSFGLKLNYVAPGQEIYSTARGGDYGIYNGTSFAAPVVSGILGLLASQDPSGNPDVWISRLNEGVKDLGAAGWDLYYGSGLVSAGKSLAVTFGSLVNISFPKSNSGILPGMLPIVGTAVSPEFKKLLLSYGIGENPLSYTLIAESRSQVLQDTIGWWDAAALPDSQYTLKLELTTVGGKSYEHHTPITLNHTPPGLDSLRSMVMWKDGSKGLFIEAYTDDISRINLFYKEENRLQWMSQYSGYPQKSHAFFLDEAEVSGNVRYYFMAENLAGQHSEVKAPDGQPFSELLPPSPPTSADILSVNEKKLFGYWLKEPTDLDSDGIPEIWGYLTTPETAQPALGFAEIGEEVIHTTLAQFPAFPRSFADVNQDGMPELLAGYGAESYLVDGQELSNPGVPPQKIPINDFWGAEMGDMEGDGNTEILALHNNEWAIFRIENYAPLQVSLLQILQNNSSGANEYSVPRALVFNADADPEKEIMFGDSDGDLLLFDYDGNRYAPVNRLKMAGTDATHRYTLGDFDGDGRKEAAVLTQRISPYVGETGISRNYWVLQVVQIDDQLSMTVTQTSRFFGLTDEKGTFSGVSSGDINADGRDELFVSVYPQIYLFSLQAGEWQRWWSRSGVNANQIPVLPGGRFLLPSENGVALLEYDSEMPRLQAPQQIAIEDLSDSAVVFQWKENPLATHYRVIRRSGFNQIPDTLICKKNSFADSFLVPGREMYYRFQALDSTGTFLPGQLSAEIRIVPELPPQFESVSVLSQTQLSLSFSRPLGSKAFTQSYFRTAEGVKPSSTLLTEGGKRLLLTFPNSLPAGSHQLIIANLFSWQNARFLKDSLKIPFTIAPLRSGPYLTSVEFISRNRLVLYFNHSMDQASVENTANYVLEPFDQIVGAEQDPEDPRRVTLLLEGKNRMGSLGSAYYLTVKNLKDQSGELIDGKLGNRVRIYREVQSLDEAFVFPNPLRPDYTEKKITFGNIPKGSEIFVFTANGRRVVQLFENGGDGGVEWDLRNSAGQPVKSGVYIYLIKKGEDQKKGKFVIIR